MKKLSQKILNSLRWSLNWLQGKKQGPDFHNIYHPDFNDVVEPAFKVGNKQYYRFARETSMPWGRYMYLQTFLYEQGLRMDLTTLNGYIQKIKYAIQGKPNTVDLITIIRTITQMESRVELAFEVDTTYRLASVMFFDDQEDLYTYDKPHNDKKIATWKESRVVDFFYTLPMSELIGLNGSSPEDLVRFIEQQNALLKELTTETPAP